MITTNQSINELNCDAPGRTDVDTLNRVVKMAVDAGEVASFDAAYELFKSYRLCVVVGPELRVSPTHQAALLTIVNAGRRALLGGVVVVGDVDCPLLVPFPGFDGLSEAIEGMGGVPVAEIPENVPTLIVGSPRNVPSKHPVTLQVTFSDWRGGVVPRSKEHTADGAEAIVPAAILAAALGVSEAFQHLRGNPMAGRRSVGMSLWSPA